MKVLVTGATGFTGEWVTKELDISEHAAVAFSGDVRDKSTFPKEPFGVIIHLAALVTHRQHQTAGDFYEVNVQGTKNLCEAYPSAKMIYISTTDVTREQLSEYAKSKLEAEKVVEKQEDYVIIRLPSVFGPKQRQIKLIPLLFRKYCQNGECAISNNDLREYIYVGDVAKHIVDSMNKRGVITIKGFKISNLDLDTMIRAICQREVIPDLTPEEQKFFFNLEHCLPTFAQNEVIHMKLFFDLDGTLIDISERYYRVYSDILTEAGFSTIGKEEYWDAKRHKVPEDQILAMTDAKEFYEQYTKKRVALIESDYYLSNDRLQEGVIEVLKNFSMKYQLILVTLRRSASQLYRQLVDLELIDYFTDVLSSGEDLEPRWMIKYNLIKEYLGCGYDSSHILVGDTETDIKAGNEIGFKTIAVSNGIRIKELLILSNPTFICESVGDILNLESIYVKGVLD